MPERNIGVPNFVKFFLFSCGLSEKRLDLFPDSVSDSSPKSGIKREPGANPGQSRCCAVPDPPADRKGFTLRCHWPRRRAGKAWTRNKSEDLPDRFDAGNARGLAFRYRMSTSLQLFGPGLCAETALRHPVRVVAACVSVRARPQAIRYGIIRSVVVGSVFGRRCAPLGIRPVIGHRTGHHAR